MVGVESGCGRGPGRPRRCGWPRPGNATSSWASSPRTPPPGACTWTTPASPATDASVSRCTPRSSCSPPSVSWSTPPRPGLRRSSPAPRGWADADRARAPTSAGHWSPISATPSGRSWPRSPARRAGRARPGRARPRPSALATIWQQLRAVPSSALAPSAPAAHTLQRGALGVPCETTAKWLHESTGDGAAQRAVAFVDGRPGPEQSTSRRRRPGRAAERRQSGGTPRPSRSRWRAQARADLVIVDEASLADTRTLAALVCQARDAEAKVLLVGDHLQRGSVDAGGGFAMLARRGPTAELTSLFRFSRPWEARASLELRRAHPAALDAYDRPTARSPAAAARRCSTPPSTRFTAARRRGPGRRPPGRRQPDRA